MKKLLLVIAVLASAVCYGQSLPIDFEGTIVTAADFTDFDGGYGTVVANPLVTPDNMSDSVGRIIRSGGQVWAGSKISLVSNIDFTALGWMSMKVYTTAPIGTTVKFKLEGMGAPAERDAWTTTSGAWETLIWNFTGTPTDLNDLVLMFDFGNTGDSSITSTFYFDDIQLVSGPPPAVPTTLPIDWESASVNDATLEDFDGGTSAVIANPSVDCVNPSDSVARIVRQGGALWSGSKIRLTSLLDFSTMPYIAMKVYTDAPVGSDMQLKLEGNGAPTEVIVPSGAAGAWHTLTWDFTGTPVSYDYLVFMFDIGNLGDGSNGSTFYVDDIQQLASPPGPDPVAASLPIDFEAGVITNDFVNFDGGTATVIANPQMIAGNMSATVGQLVRNGGTTAAGSKLCLTDSLDFTTESLLQLLVYTDAAAGTTVRLELEGESNTIAADALTTVSGAWDTLQFDFSGQPSDLYKLSFLFDFGNVGDGSASSTFLFDDVMQVMPPDPLPGPETTTLPITFEDEVSAAYFINSDGGTGTVIPNFWPDFQNLSDSVGQVVNDGGTGQARSLITLSDPLDFSTQPWIAMKVWTEAPAGTTVRLQLEGTDTTTADAMTTSVGAWETLYFDFTGHPTDLVNIAFVFDPGTIGDGSATSTFRFDDVQQVDSPVVIGVTEAMLQQQVQAYPNPGRSYWTISAGDQQLQSVVLINVLGQEVARMRPHATRVDLDAASLPKGAYIARIQSGDETVFLKLVKE